jgi:3-deoxy-D-manno-octulosonic-acid transferase
MGRLLQRFAVVTAQDAAVAAELRALGWARSGGGPARRGRAAEGGSGELAALGDAVAGRVVWAAVSTHPADEGAVAGAHRAVLAAHPGALLIWAPRHPARAEAAVAALDGLRVVRRSLGGWPGPGVDVLLVDPAGGDGAGVRVAPLTFLGGGFGPEGGHNPWEPARLGSAVLSGPGVANHRDGFRRLQEAGAARIVDSPERLAGAVAGLLGSAELEAMRAAAAQAVQGSGARGADAGAAAPPAGGRGGLTHGGAARGHLNDTSTRYHHGCARVMRLLVRGLEDAGIEIAARVPARADWARDARVVRGVGPLRGGGDQRRGHAA